MHRSQSSGSITARLPIPRDLHVGAVIGPGGSHVKKIRAQTGAYCKLDDKKHEAVMSGSRDRVDRAVEQLQDLFHRLRLDRLQRLEKLRQQRWQQREKVPGPNRIYRVAVATDSNNDSWLFQRRSGASNDDDSNDNCLIRLETFDDGDDDVEIGDDLKDSWISKFTRAFRQQMTDDIGELSTRTDIKIKAALGLTCYSFPNAHTASRLFKWGQLQRLQLQVDARRRWENCANVRSTTVSSLMRTLESLIPPNTIYETLLTVYIGDSLGANDISLKFQWVDGVWEWVQNRPPIRIAHALYNIGLDDETAFRIGVYSRASADSVEALSELRGHVILIEHPSGDPFRTKVQLADDTPQSLFIRSLALRQKTRVDHDGLRFSISYCDAYHKEATVQCQLVDDDSTDSVSAAHCMQSLVDRMLAVLQLA